MELVKYPDGTSYVKVVEKSSCPYVFRINSYKDLWYLNQLVDANNSLGIIPEIHIPNLIDAQADRRFGIGESSGLKLVCNFLNSMKAKFVIFHPHNQEVVEALMDNVVFKDNSDFIQAVLERLGDNSNTILMASDAGGFKPLMKLCDKLDWKGETYSASKARTETGMKQFIDRQDFNGKDILIIDDICVFGGTFKGLSKLLRERNCGKLYLAVSHMTVQNLGKDPVTNYFDKVFTTDSKFKEYYYTEPAEVELFPGNLEILKTW
jgi:ribose-phosphate pyrophosphokinase